jgi:hypothetical protein
MEENRMAQSYDVSLKALFLREGGGIVHRMLFGGKIAEVLATEQPKVYNHRADLVLRTEDGKLHQVEFQTANESGFARRMLGYYVHLEGEYGEHVMQTVLYMGREPMRLANTYSTPVLDFQFLIVNLRELDGEPLLESPDWVDNVLALLAKGSPERALDVVLPKIRLLQGEEQELAAGTLTLLSGIMGLEETVERKLREATMIDVMENKILGPAIRKGLEQGLQKGREEGQLQGRHALLQRQLTVKFGTLPAWAQSRLASGTTDEIDAWATRILTSTSLEDTFQ